MKTSGTNKGNIMDILTVSADNGSYLNDLLADPKGIIATIESNQQEAGADSSVNQYTEQIGGIES